MDLGFDELRAANVKRCREFRNAQGVMCHPEGVDGWSPSQWMVAVVGEVGETANILKKVERGDFTLESVREDLRRELADVQTYLDLLAASLGVDLGRATVDKFNEVSERVGSDVKLHEHRADYAVNLAREAYEAYCQYAGWKSIVTGADLPQWPSLNDSIRQAWMVSAAWVVGRVMRLNGLVQLQTIVRPAGGESACD
jgi:NTP pyrophosphatase (non-canonical NTP hydrolase)